LFSNVNSFKMNEELKDATTPEEGNTLDKNEEGMTPRPQRTETSSRRVTLLTLTILAER
jgi:hypothetical protein